MSLILIGFLGAVTNICHFFYEWEEFLGTRPNITPVFVMDSEAPASETGVDPGNVVCNEQAVSNSTPQTNSSDTSTANTPPISDARQSLATATGEFSESSEGT